MSSIKERITKKAHSDPRVTIDSVHSTIIKTLDDKQRNDYYLNNGLLLHEYYSGTINTPITKDKGILSFFNKESNNVDNSYTGCDIIETYMSNISDTYETKCKKHKTDTCKECGNNMLYTLTRGELICNSMLLPHS